MRSEAEGVLAIIPARSGSQSIPNKNFRLLMGMAPVVRAYECAGRAGCDKIVVTTDKCYPGAALLCGGIPDGHYLPTSALLFRPPKLATDEAKMIDVVRHVLEQIPGPPDQPIVLLQPTQPLRTPAHITQALEALTSDWDSVVTIKPIPRTHAPEFVLCYQNSTLGVFPYCDHSKWGTRPTRRQDVPWPYVADGTAYAFYRRTVAEYGNIFGEYVRGLIIPARETCALDTPEDWADAERRLQAREHEEWQNL